MKKFACVLFFVLLLSLPVSAIFYNNVLVVPAGKWFGTNDSVFVSSTQMLGSNTFAGADYAEIAYPFQEFMKDRDGNIYDQFLTDPFVVDGSYNSNSVRLTFNKEPPTAMMQNFYPSLYITSVHPIEMAPGDVIEFYVAVTNVFVSNSYSSRLWYNAISSASLGQYSSIYTADDRIVSQIDTFTVNNYGSGYSDRVVQKITFINKSTDKLGFTGMQLIFGQSDEYGNLRTRGGDTGVNYIYVNCCLSPVIRYNTLANNSDIIGSIDKVDDKLDDVIDSVGDVSDELKDINDYLSDVPDLSEWEEKQSLVSNIALEMMNHIHVTPVWLELRPVEVSFIEIMWQCLDRLFLVGIPYDDPQLSFIELSKSEESKTGHFNLIDWLMWYTSVFLTRTTIFVVSKRARDLDKPIGDDEE